ncbi:methyltransferase domain-containing protein [Ferrovibrio sp.]|uniref:methyltransferase domain-containing protein n=1 Tax=Ferrovibrio sp. TaxID=1917215 RepID=UPI003D26B768
MSLPSPESLAAKAHLLPLLKAALKAVNEQRHEEAERLIASILEQEPGMADAVHARAHIALARGDLAKAEALARQAIALDFHYEDYHITLAQALLGQGDAEGAKQSVGVALGLNNASAEAYMILADVYKQQNDLESARGALRMGKQHNPNNAEIRFRLGTIESALGSPNTALTYYQQALQLRPEQPLYRIFYARSLRKWHLKQPNPALLATVMPLIGKPGVSPRDLTGIVEGTLLLDVGIQSLLGVKEQLPKIIARLMDSPQFPKLGNNTVLLQWLRYGEVVNPDLEALCAVLRRGALWLALAKPEALAPHAVWLDALAARNFHADYLDPETVAERERLAVLDQQISAIVATGQLPGAGLLALYACYRPIYRRADAAALAALRWPAVIGELRRVQLDEPLYERELAASMPNATPIEDATSQFVREMYEESPFPRWNQPIIGFNASVGQIIRSVLPLQRLPGISVDRPDVLVAGCGTGQHAILAATNYGNSQVLAVDLSRASLAYGKRKTQELGYKNIEFAQADILKLGQLPRRFDIIESFGVLHHMRDPLAGLKQLTMLLKPDGYMMLGLYSEVARRDVVLSRQLIAKHGYADTPDDIRRFRIDLPQLDAELYARLRKSPAFYNLPDFRDLVFHRQEHRYYPEQLGDLARDAGLRFLGFDFTDQNILRDYLADYPDDPQAVNLSHWAEYERRHPNLFANCFRFWLDKRV